LATNGAELVILALVRALPGLASVVFLAVLAGGACSPSTGDGIGSPCSLDEPCSEGVCNLSGPGEPTCLAPDEDFDNDGLPNNRDFCNQQAGGEFDEDQDGIGDECDACPVSRPPERPDTDNDGVDAPCDPEPDMDGEQITIFEGFNAALDPNKFRAVGTWEARGGEAVFTATDPNATQTLVTSLPIASRHLAIFTSYRSNGVPATATQAHAGVTTVDRRPAGTSIVSCSSLRVGTMDSVILETDVGNSSKPFLVSLFDAAGLYRVVERIENANSQCVVLADGGQGAVQQATGGEQPSEGGLTARGADVRFQYLLVVQRPN
jgi:hypothetical protein